MINTQTYKKADKQKEKKNKQTTQLDHVNKQTCICVVLIQGNEKNLMKFAAVSAKTLKTVKCLPKNLFNIDILA